MSEKRRKRPRKRPAPHVREDRIARTEAPGAPPGTLTVEPDSRPPSLNLIAFGPDEIVEETVTDLEQVRAARATHAVTWLNVNGLGDLELIRQIGELFGLHHLTLEDLVHVDQRPKLELFPSYAFVVSRMVYLDDELVTEQLGLLFGDGFVLTVQEGRPGDNLDPVRSRLRHNIGHVRAEGPGYLAYAILDAVVDHYFPVLEQYGDRLDELEDEVLGASAHNLVTRIHDVKRDLLVLRRAITPQRDGIARLGLADSDLINERTRLHLRDVSDHTEQLIDLLDSYREVASSLIEMHLSLAGHRMNEVMKVLTVIGSLFIPLTFITGVYGMNFNPHTSPWNMPELGARYGYPLVLAAMALVTAGLLLFFYRRGWIGARKG